ncbi:helix-turn-helix domain-containing protein [Saccharomonospora sp. NPDC046836]|uniref:helix-turn-helix domain-containing protein n=1 Tax=Saccharomonospora sp. NPDC046836 TaxID=3156921 RepID=UPI0033FA47B0
MFHVKGYSAASVLDVADTVGVLKGSLYHYKTSASGACPPRCASKPSSPRSCTGTSAMSSGAAFTSTNGATSPAKTR